MKKGRNEAMVGLFVIIGFICLALVVFFISGVYFFRPGYGLSVLYDYVSILDKGAPVRMAGVRIGEVSKVELIYDEALQKVRVKVKLFIENKVEIRESYHFKIEGTHILSEPHIEITPQPGNSPLLQADKIIEGMEPVPIDDLITNSQDIIENLDGITASLKTVLDGSEQDLKDSFRNFKVVSDSLSKGEGTIGKLVTEDKLYQEMREFVAEIKARPWRLLKRDDEKKRFLFF